MFPVTLQTRAFARIEAPLPAMLHFAIWRLGERQPYARVATRKYANVAEGCAELSRWYPGCLIYAYDPEIRERNGIIVN